MSTTSPRKPRVLVVDDEAAIRGALSRGLRGAYDVVLAADGQEAIELLERDPAINAVVTDLDMPNLGGIELHRWLMRHLPGLAGRTIVMTGGRGAHMEWLATFGGEVIDKPASLDAIRASLERVMAS